ncbi:hypothetical protein WMY93_024148 [Mugilogobius chulae]|uniref:Uncharacterized protein n=1 Tax=Mugilogobius chulae TaxID=88201 RepID=A0AAW0NHG9_9GOBI
MDTESPRVLPLQQRSASPSPPPIHPPSTATISPTAPSPPGAIDGLLLTVHTAARSCSDRGQPDRPTIGLTREERGDDCAGNSLAFFLPLSLCYNGANQRLSSPWQSHREGGLTAKQATTRTMHQDREN